MKTTGLLLAVILLIAQSQAYYFNQMNLMQIPTGSNNQSSTNVGLYEEMSELEDKINHAASEIRYIRQGLSHTFYLDGEIQDTFHYFDANQNGELDVTEFGHALHEAAQQFGLPPIPAGSDGEDIIESVIDELDLDQSGTLDIVEFDIATKAFLVDVVAYWGIQIGRYSVRLDNIVAKLEESAQQVQSQQGGGAGQQV